MSQHNQRHDAGLYADALKQAFGGLVLRESDNDPEESDIRVAIRLQIDQAMHEYKKLDPTIVFIEMQGRVVTHDDRYIDQWRGTVIGVDTLGDGEYVTLAIGKQWIVGLSHAIQLVCDVLPVIPLLDAEGTHSYPAYSDRKRRLMDEAEERRERKRNKLMQTLGVATTIAVGSGYKGL